MTLSGIFMDLNADDIIIRYTSLQKLHTYRYYVDSNELFTFTKGANSINVDIKYSDILP